MAKRRGVRASAKKTAARTGRKAAARRGPVVGTRGGGRPRPAEGDGVDEQLVERTVALLTAHDAAVGASKRRIGAHVLDEYFGGDEALARSRDPGKSVSFRRLAERAEESTGWKERDLREAVTMELCARSLPAQVAERIDPSYLTLLDGIEDLEARREIATRLARDELRGEAARLAIRAAAGEPRGGRRPLAAPVKHGNDIAREVDQAAVEGVFEAGPLAALSLEELEDLARMLQGASEKVEDFVRFVREATKARREAGTRH